MTKLGNHIGLLINEWNLQLIIVFLKIYFCIVFPWLSRPNSPWDTDLLTRNRKVLFNPFRSLNKPDFNRC